jgi:hypothetical protein
MSFELAHEHGDDQVCHAVKDRGSAGLAPCLSTAGNFKLRDHHNRP